MKVDFLLSSSGNGITTEEKIISMVASQLQRIGVWFEQQTIRQCPSPAIVAQIEQLLFVFKSLVKKKPGEKSALSRSSRYLACKRLIELGHTTAASRIIQRLLRRREKYTDQDLAEIGFLRLLIHEDEGALALFREVQLRTPEHPLSFIGTAQCFARRKDRAAWLECIFPLRRLSEKLLALTPREQLELIRALIQGEEREYARTLLAKLIEQSDCPATIWYEYAALLRNTGHYTLAARECSRGLEQFPTSSPLLALRELLEGDLAVYEKGYRPSSTLGSIKPKDTKTVLHLLEASLPHRSSGYAYRTHHILQTQKAMGYHPAAVTRPGFGAGALLEEISNIPYYRLPCSGHPNYRWNRLDRYLQEYTDKAGEVLSDLKPAVIHAVSNFKNGLVARALSDATGIPFVYELRGLWEDSQVAVGAISEDSERYRFFRKLEDECLQAAHKVITLSETLKSDLISRGIASDKIHIVPNAIDPALFSYTARDQALSQTLQIGDGPVMGFVGSLTLYEGLELLIEAFVEILNEIPTAKLLIVGSGAAEVRLHEVVERLHLERSVLLPGRVPQSEVNRYVSLIDLMVIPRQRSRVCELVPPLKPLEAMAAGKALLMSDLKVLRELSGDGEYARYFTADDPESLVEVAVPLLQDKDARDELGKKARLYAQENRTWEVVAQEYQRVYDELV